MQLLFAVLILLFAGCSPEQSGGLSGRLVDAAGQPLAGRAIRLDHVGLYDGSLDPAFEARQGWHRAGTPVRVDLETDERGRFRAGRLLAGDYWVFTRSQDQSAFAPYHMDRRLNAEPAGANVELGDLVFVDRRLMLRVRDQAGSRVELDPGSDLRLYRADERGRRLGSQDWRPFRAEPDGWSVPVRAESRYLVQLRLPGHPAVRRTLAVGQEPAIALDLVLPRAQADGTVAVAFQAQGGEAYDGDYVLEAEHSGSGARMALLRIGGREARGSAGPALDLPAGRYSITARPVPDATRCASDMSRAPDDLGQTALVEVLAGERQSLVLRASPGAVLAVEVGDWPAGFGPRSSPGRAAAPSTSGRCRREALGGLRLWLEDESGETRELWFPEGSVSSLGSGALLLPAFERASFGGHFVDYVVPGTRGFVWPSLPPGSWTLRGELAGTAPTALPLHLVAGETTVAQVELRSPEQR